MKMDLISAITLVGISLVSGEGLYYYGRGEKIVLGTYKDMISVKWREDVNGGEKEKILATFPNATDYYHIERY